MHNFLCLKNDPDLERAVEEDVTAEHDVDEAAAIRRREDRREEERWVERNERRQETETRRRDRMNGNGLNIVERMWEDYMEQR